MIALITQLIGYIKYHNYNICTQLLMWGDGVIIKRSQMAKTFETHCSSVVPSQNKALGMLTKELDTKEAHIYSLNTESDLRTDLIMP